MGIFCANSFQELDVYAGTIAGYLFWDGTEKSLLGKYDGIIHSWHNCFGATTLAAMEGFNK